MWVHDALDLGAHNSDACGNARFERAAASKLTRECATSSAMCDALTKAMRQNGHSNAAAAQLEGACSVGAFAMLSESKRVNVVGAHVAFWNGLFA